MSSLRIGVYGTNGHQILGALKDHPRAKLVAAAAVPDDAIPSECGVIRRYERLDELLADDAVDLVSLCSPRRADQASDAIRCMEAGKHAYAEKPCALAEADLDAILDAAERTGRVFHEMADTAFAQPYWTLRHHIAAGAVGTVVQVLAQKSYPYHDRRPTDEAVDGGLVMQAGVHAFRFVEHVAGVRIAGVQAMQTRFPCPKEGDLRMACSVNLALENGGLGTVLCNYLNRKNSGTWGNEALRVFGTDGMIEAVDGGTRTRLLNDDGDCRDLTPVEPEAPFLDQVFRHAIEGKNPLPFSLEEEVHPTRMVIRARAGATDFR